MLHFPRMQHFGKIPKKIGQNLANNQQNSDKFCKFHKRKSAKNQYIFNAKLRLENDAKKCIVQISTRAFQRVFTCKIQLRYSRERALKSSGKWEFADSAQTFQGDKRSVQDRLKIRGILDGPFGGTSGPSRISRKFGAFWTDATRKFSQKNFMQGTNQLKKTK